MKRSMWGITLLAAATGLWSCNGDPTGDLRAGERILADPASVFLDEGATKFVTVQLIDGQGNQLATDFSAQNVGSGITVEKDPTFLQTTINTHLPTQARFVVTGTTPVVSSFDVSAGDSTLTIPVRVLPTSFTPGFSTAAPAQNEIVTITAPSGFSFASASAVVSGADTGVIVSKAADGSTLSFVAKPGLDTLPTTSRLTVVGTTSDLYSSVPLTLPTTDSITIAPVAAIAGTDAPGSAPTFAAPLAASGTVTAVFDKGTFTGADVTAIGFGATANQYYQITIPEAGDYSIAVGWDGTSDLDAFVCPTIACDTGTQLGSGSANPESSILTLAPATYFLVVSSYHDPLAPETIPGRIGFTISRP